MAAGRLLPLALCDAMTLIIQHLKMFIQRGIDYFGNIALMSMIWVICFIACLICLLWMLIAVLANAPRGFTIALGVDVLACYTTGGAMEPISSRCWRYRNEKRYAMLVDMINVLARDPNHCENAFDAEEARRKKDYESSINAA